MGKAVIFSRFIKPEWLDLTVERWIEYQDAARVKEVLNLYLADQTDSPTVLRKTREILMRTWVDVEEPLQFYRDWGIAVYQSSSRKERLAVHWLMLLVVYPIFKDLCAILGKLFVAQDTVTTSQLNRRVFDLWGERTTLLHSLNKLIRTLKEFGVLQQQKPGIYSLVTYPIQDEGLIEWMLYGIIKSGDKLYHRLPELLNNKELFAFDFATDVQHLMESQRLKLDRVGGELVVSV